MDQSLDNIGIKYAFDFGKGKNYTGGDKTSLGHNFTKTYDNLFIPIKNNIINILELGIFHGKSLAMWSDYFPNGKIYGIDIDLKPYTENIPKLKREGAFTHNNVIVFEQNVTAPNFGELVSKLPVMDIIIDDALHHADIQFNNFKIFFPKLNKNGYYIIEDIVEPGKHIELFKNLYLCVSNTDSTDIKRNPFYSTATKIESITIQQNMIIIKKKTMNK